MHTMKYYEVAGSNELVAHYHCLNNTVEVENVRNRMRIVAQYHFLKLKTLIPNIQFIYINPRLYITPVRVSDEKDRGMELSKQKKGVKSNNIQ